MGRRAGRRRQRQHRVHHQDRDARARPDRSGPSAPRCISSTASPTRSRPTGPSCRSISSAASARRCSACRRTTCSGFSKSWSTGRVHNRIVVPTSRSTGPSRARPDAVHLNSVLGPIGSLVRSPNDPLRAAGRALPSHVRPVFRLPSTARRTNGARTSQTSLRLRRARAAHRRADDADPSREASSGVRHQPERRAREASRAAVEEHRGSVPRHQQRSRRHPHRGAQQRRRPLEPHACSGRGWRRTPAARRPARSPTRSTRRSAASTRSRSSGARRAPAASAAAGCGCSTTAASCRSPARRIRTIR